MKALFVSTMRGFPWGGSERLWSAAAQEAIDLGWQVAFSTYRWPVTPGPITRLIERGALWLPRSLESKGASIAGIAPMTETQTGLRDCTSLFAFEPDVVCISQGSTYDFLSLNDLCAALRQWGGPYVLLCRFNVDDVNLDEGSRTSAAQFFAAARYVGFAAIRNLAAAERQIGMAIPHAGVMQSPIDLPGFSALPWPIPGTPAFACVARLDIAYKGQDLLFEALSAPAWANRNWRLRMFGEGPDRIRCEALVRDLGLCDRIRFHGHVDDVAGVWLGHHMLVLPSREEGTPQSLIESMVCGRPSVCTDVGGVKEWLVEGESGFIAEKASVSSLRCALERAWDLREDWGPIGRLAHTAALDKLEEHPEQRLIRLLRDTQTAASGH